MALERGHIFHWTQGLPAHIIGGMITIHHLEFTEKLMAQIVETIKTEPLISRRRLSQRICAWMNWRSPNGKLRR